MKIGERRWGQDTVKSTCYVYKCTIGTPMPVTPVSSVWNTLQLPEDNQTVYEELPEGVPPNIQRDHVLVQKDAQHKDMDVPRLAASGSKWESLAVPGMIPEMVHVADLQYKAEWFIVNKLNELMKERGLGIVTYISDAVSKLRNKFVSSAEKEELREVLVDVFKHHLGSEECATAAIEQWPEVMKWRGQRVAFAHPLGKNVVDPEKLNVLKAQVQQAQEYASVRDAALALIAAAEQMPSALVTDGL